VTDAFVAELRGEIDGIDRELLATINRRLVVVRRLHDHKLEHGVPLRDPGREEALLAMLGAVNTGPLSRDGVADFFRHVLDLTRRELHGD
jgi:chorismate mutase/prephenate dehydratase